MQYPALSRGIGSENTFDKISVRYIVFKKGGVWYAAGLEFNIVEAGHTPQAALYLLFEAIEGYLESAQRIKNGVKVLNQKVDSKYELIWRTLTSKKSPMLKSVFAFGRHSLIPI